ncbi:hypothetical protein [Streptomyces sp. TRM70350]|uniref:hypothetical protein n=1 Tax=Streptomyces sp. TRM70350 TaxID=2856165 RepID=UPI001C460D79|nr:hypothetical protein [Streptomyces sp. TRM70350]MBV7696538.1 hypothetical protein [Streptomyces sp. TRM70350]
MVAEKTGKHRREHQAASYNGILRESSGNPKAINDWDSNAAAGIPFKGVLVRRAEGVRQSVDGTLSVRLR